MTVTAPMPRLPAAPAPAPGRHRRPPPRRERSPAHCRETLAHRIRVTALVAAATTALYLMQHILWPRSAPAHTLAGQAWSLAGLLWVLGAVPAVFELAGLYLWRAPRAAPDHISQLVCWRIVSRGINTAALAATIEGCRREMARMPLFRYVIEVVMDSNSSPEASDLPPAARDLRYIIVPRDYATPAGTRNKARALHYALQVSDLPGDAWIVHMDEESQPTSSGITGIAAAIREEDELRPGCPRIGQGTITYHRNWEAHPFFTLSDCIRSGSDRGRLYLSMKAGIPFFGLHGSFIVIRNDVEQGQGFDIGPVGSLTEDAWWGTIAMDRGIRCRWVEGYISEQCTERARDFIQQRRRWFNGMGRTALRVPASLKWRVVLSVSMIAWASAPLAWAYTIAHLVAGGYISPEIRALANFSLAVYVATTLVGLGMNMAEHGITGAARTLRWSLTWLVCLPVFSLMEAVAVSYAMARPVRAFYVVQK
jgi:egghead protein (zeste-white 4 protein)